MELALLFFFSFCGREEIDREGQGGEGMRPGHKVAWTSCAGARRGACVSLRWHGAAAWLGRWLWSFGEDGPGEWGPPASEGEGKSSFQKFQKWLRLFRKLFDRDV